MATTSPLASGHAMLGVTLASVTGDLVAQLIGENKVREVLEPFDPLRFSRSRPTRRVEATT